VDVAAQAERLGFHLEATVVDTTPVWAWRRGSDTDWPSFLTQAEALGWMEDAIRHATLFDRRRRVVRIEDIEAEAKRRGWELDETYRRGRYVFCWVGRPDDAQVPFETESEALSWMRQRLADEPRTSL